MANISNHLGIILIYPCVVCPFIVPLAFNSIWISILLNEMPLLYPILRSFSWMSIDVALRFCRLVWDVCRCRFLVIRVRYFTSLSLNDWCILLFLFGLICLFIDLGRVYRIQTRTIFWWCWIILRQVLGIMPIVFQIISTLLIVPATMRHRWLSHHIVI